MGEDLIVSELVAKHLGSRSSSVIIGPGDDSAVLHSPPQGLATVLTVDPCPTPVLELLGQGRMRDWGRLSATISLSDIAAMGATPTAILSSTDMPPSMRDCEYEDFLSGLSAACKEFGVSVVGGNVREGSSFNATTVAIGWVDPASCLRRTGAKPDDRLLVIGECGRFWAGVLGIMNGEIFPEEIEQDWVSALRYPTAKVAAGKIVADLGLAHAAIDCSDGLGEAVMTLSAASGLGANLDRRALLGLAPSSAATRYGVSALALALAWGDWQLLVAVPSENVGTVSNGLAAAGIESIDIGSLVEGTGLMLEASGKTVPLRATYGSKRFSRDSYMISGLEAYALCLREARAELGE